MKRPGLITLLAVLQFLGAGFWLLVAIATVLGGAVPAAALLFVLAALQLACGAGLWTLRPYGRILQLVFAGIGLLAVPFGTVVAILILMYLTRPGMKIIFSGKPAEALTPDERAQMAAVPVPSGIIVALVVVVAGVGTVICVSIIAAVAIPGLLRARMTANETAAIATLSEVAIAEAAYAGSCGNGGFAGSLAALTAPMPDGKSPVSPDLQTLATSGRHGYFYALGQGAGTTAGPADCRGVPTVTEWYATATPQTFGASGTRSFATNARGVIWQVNAPEPPGEPFGAPAVEVLRGPRVP